MLLKRLSALRFRVPEGERNEADRISFRRAAGRALLAASGGVLLALALPPCNLWWFAFFALTPPVLAAWRRKFLAGFGLGWLWGIGWALPGYWFLREIDPAVPWGIAPIAALWPGVWAALLPGLIRNAAYPLPLRLEGAEAMAAHKPAAWRLWLVAAAAAGLWVVLEYTRSTMLPWNNLSTPMWRFPKLLTIASAAGQYGIGFAVGFVGVLTALCALLRGGGAFRWRAWLAAPVPLLALLLFAAAVRPAPVLNRRIVRIAAVQGDISQRRNASGAQAEEALTIYLDLTKQAQRHDSAPELIVWPETAVPYAYRGDHPVCAAYRNEVRLLTGIGAPMLIGTIDFLPLDPEEKAWGVANSALLIRRGEVAAKYDKTHRVPYGEYIPFRSWLPNWIIRKIDMNRDLTPGRSLQPVEVLPGVRAGIAICFESVFPYIARAEARRGANLLIVLSNDAWYPTSSEPEQHLANAVMRSVETGLPSLRCGNNGGTLLVAPDGSLQQVLEVPGTGAPELRRGRGIGYFDVPVPEAPPMTFHTRFGDWFVGLAALLAAAGWGLAAQSRNRERRRLTELLEPIRKETL